MKFSPQDICCADIATFKSSRKSSAVCSPSILLTPIFFSRLFLESTTIFCDTASFVFEADAGGVDWLICSSSQVFCTSLYFLVRSSTCFVSVSTSVILMGYISIALTQFLFADIHLLRGSHSCFYSCTSLRFDLVWVDWLSLRWLYCARLVFASC